MYSGLRNVFKLREMSDNISEIVQDKNQVTMYVRIFICSSKAIQRVTIKMTMEQDERG